MSTASLVIEEGGKTVLAVPTGVGAADFIKSEIGSLQREPGWIVSEQGIRPWPILGFMQREGQIHFWGEHQPGVRLADCLEEDPPANLARLRSLARSLLTLSREKTGYFPLRADGVFFLEDGSVLFMPPSMMQRISLLKPFSERVRTYNVINHPDLSGSRAHVFTLGALAYRVTLGQFPFHGEDDVEINGRIRSLKVTPPSMQRPDIRRDLSELIVRSLDKNTRVAPTVEEWDALLGVVAAEGHTRDVGEAERQAAARERTERDRKSQASYRRTVFFQRNWRLLAIIGAVVVIVGSVAGSILSNVLAPRVTRGYTPLQVVQTFYNAMNGLDHTTMEDTVVDKAGQGEINEAMNLYVVTRVTMGYEGISYIRNAKEWDEAGRPTLDPSESLYGAILNEVTEIAPEPAPAFRVSYEKWSPEPEGDQDSTRKSFGYSRVDNVYLRLDKGDWVIYRIDRLESTPVAES